MADRTTYIYQTLSPLSVKRNQALRKLEEFPSEETLMLYKNAKHAYDDAVSVLLRISLEKTNGETRIE